MQRKNVRIKAFSLSAEAAERVETIAKVTGRSQTSIIEALIMDRFGLDLLMNGQERQRFDLLDRQIPQVEAQLS